MFLFGENDNELNLSMLLILKIFMYPINIVFKGVAMPSFIFTFSYHLG